MLLNLKSIFLGLSNLISISELAFLDFCFFETEIIYSYILAYKIDLLIPSDVKTKRKNWTGK